MFPQQFDKNIHSTIQEYLNEVVAELNKLSEELVPIKNKLVSAIKNGANVFAFGNGGSNAEAESFLYALDKEVGLEFRFGSYGNPKRNEMLDALNIKLFEHTLRRHGKEGDIAFLLSASGDSLNILDASRICKRLGITSVSISANGKIANDRSVEPDHPIIISLGDQQKLEEVTLGLLLILAKDIGIGLKGESLGVLKTNDEYVSELKNEAAHIITPQLLLSMVEDIFLAFRHSKTVRIDATTGLLDPIAEHMAHNLVWDARDESKEIWSNKVISGISGCHMTGVGNDGGCGYNLALEILDNCRGGDVEILLTTNAEDVKSRSLIKAARERAVSLHTICFGSKFVSPGVAQIAAHLTGRLTNTRILLEQGVIDQTKAAEWFRKHDLALLRKKEEIRGKLQKIFAV